MQVTYLYRRGFVWARQWWAVATPLPRAPAVAARCSWAFGSGRGAVCAPQTRCRRRSPSERSASHTRNFLTRAFAKLFYKYLFSICCSCCCYCSCCWAKSNAVPSLSCHTSKLHPLSLSASVYVGRGFKRPSRRQTNL